jgi:integrase
MNGNVIMLNSLPGKGERVFPSTYEALACSYRALRKRVAAKTGNLRILKITLTTFRHYGATLLYFQTKDILLVKKLLGHKRIENTVKYTQFVSFSDSEYEVATAQTLEEAKQALSAGFDYITEKNGIMLFRKPKRYMNR